MVAEPASDVIMEMGDEVMSAGAGEGPKEKILALEKESGKRVLFLATFGQLVSV